MKWFCQISAVYLLLLSCIPCSDGEHNHGQKPGSNPVQISFSTDEHGCPGHKHCNDLCSPFCGCHCCSTIVIFQKARVLSFSKILIFEKKQPFAALDFPLKEMAFAIDHPPQLG